MKTYFYNTSTNSLEISNSYFDYLDEENPQPGFFLSYFETYAPAINSSQGLKREWNIDLEAKTVTEDWVVVNYPNWVGFNLAMVGNAAKNAYDLALQSTHPTLPSKLDLAYSMIVSHGMENFQAMYTAYCAAAGVTSEHRQEWADLAENNHLPSYFSETLLG